MKAIQIEAFGNPGEVTKLVDIPDVGPPGTAEVVIMVEASPIDQYDLSMIAGAMAIGSGYRPSWAQKEPGASRRGGRVLKRNLFMSSEVADANRIQSNCSK
jgi:hypothetical protein